jgi:hypothetical protein
MGDTVAIAARFLTGSPRRVGLHIIYDKDRPMNVELEKYPKVLIYNHYRFNTFRYYSNLKF